MFRSNNQQKIKYEVVCFVFVFCFSWFPNQIKYTLRCISSCPTYAIREINTLVDNFGAPLVKLEELPGPQCREQVPTVATFGQGWVGGQRRKNSYSAYLPQSNIENESVLLTTNGLLTGDVAIVHFYWQEISLLFSLDLFGWCLMVSDVLMDTISDKTFDHLNHKLES